jgi:hypothetical protein
LPKPSQGEAAGVSGWFPRAWVIAKPYVALGLFSFLAAVVLMAIAQLTDWKSAMLAGYTADATFQKLR